MQEGSGGKVESGGYGAQKLFSISEFPSKNITLHTLHSLHTLHYSFSSFFLERRKNK
jgi:hypothetical protein